MEDNTFLAPLSPIQRSTPSQRINFFKSQESTIYNKISPYYQAGGGIGPNQPFVYTKLTDSNSTKSATARDTQALPVGSVARDLKRMGKFTITGNGILYIGKQILLQGSAPFDETRTYNLGSVIAATTQPIGGDRPVRHIESSGGLLNFFVSSLLSTIGFSTTKENLTSPIPGTATGALPTYVQAQGRGRYGLMRGETAASGKSNFEKIWVGAGSQTRNGGFLSSVLRSITSTTGLFSNSGRPADWTYRPEYKEKKRGTEDVFTYMFKDNRGLLSYTGVKALYTDANVNWGKFYNDSRDPLNYTALVQRRKKRQEAQAAIQEQEFMSNIDGTQVTTKDPDEGADLSTTVRARDVIVSLPDFNENDLRYANVESMNKRMSTDAKSGLTALYKRMFELVEGQNTEEQHPMYNKSAERYNTLTKGKTVVVSVKNNYNRIPNTASEQPYSESDAFKGKGIRIDDKGFAKSAKIEKLDKFRSGIKQGDSDSYNKLPILDGDRNTIPADIEINKGQSKDLIYFYFYDLINRKYIPFRATLSGITDAHSPDWESISYLGRADKLFVYKGFARDVNFNFKVYANSIEELIPMWERVNYLAGLTRPSKYTDSATVTNQATLEQAEFFGEDPQSYLTGKESRFMYPPMITFRIGDLYVDQPAVLSSVNITIPDDATWETLRKDGYEYIYGINGTDTITSSAKSRQLPNIIDVSVSVKLLEKQLSLTSNYHFGPQEGWNKQLV